VQAECAGNIKGVVSTETLDREVTAALRAGGHRVTTQRLLLHRFLSRQEQHLTAEQTHRAIAAELPGVSVQTIYATLELFEELGIVRKIASPTGATVFDTRSTPHHHAVCSECGAVIDLEAPLIDEPVLAAARAAGFEAARSDTVVHGVCADCRARR
jgi:Fe2+ or Zn2+ uptake regulation protein